jgi:hypothetical protein
METKVCSKCEKEKPLLEYNVCSRVKDGRKAECRECQRISGKKYRFENKEKIKEYNTKWNKENQEYYKKYFEEYYTVNYDKEKERKLKWSRENRKYSNDYQKQRKKKDILFRIISDMRNSVNRYLKYKSKSTFEIVGCTPELLKEHLEKQFTDGMTWENRSKWHIDHIIPLSSAKTEEELYKLCHYTNLQPLWAEDNMKKSNKVFTL